MIPRHMVSLPIVEAAGKLARTLCTNATIVALTWLTLDLQMLREFVIERYHVHLFAHAHLHNKVYFWAGISFDVGSWNYLGILDLMIYNYLQCKGTPALRVAHWSQPSIYSLSPEEDTLAATDNVLMAFVFGIQKGRFPLTISMRACTKENPRER